MGKKKNDEDIQIEQRDSSTLSEEDRHILQATKDQSKLKNMMETIKTFANRNRHKRSEKKIRNLAIALGIFITGSGYSVYHSYDVAKEEASKPTQVGTVVGFSQTKARMSLGETMLSSDGRTSFIPFQFDSVENLSTDTKNYTLFAISPDGSFQYKPRIQMLLYGDTGRGAFVVNADPTPKSGVIQLIVRNDKKLAVDSDGTSFNGAMSGTDLRLAGKEFDILALGINPYADGVKVNKYLDGESISPTESYRELFANADVKVTKKDIVDRRKNIKLTMTRISEYEERLERAGYTLPERPPYLNEDWRPQNAPNVDVDSTLAKGFALNTTAQKSKDKKPKDSDNVSQDSAELEEGSVSFVDNLKRDDGTYSDDAVNQDQRISGQTAQDTWQRLVVMYTSVSSDKVAIYVTSAERLAAIERDVKRQQGVTSLGSVDKTIINSPVKIK